MFGFLGDLDLDQVTLTGGYSAGGGGWNMTGGAAVITNSTITGNFATNGGGLGNNAGVLTLQNSTVSYNTAFGDRTGGGIFSIGGARTDIFFSTIYENQASGNPGFEGRGDAIADAFNPPFSTQVRNSILASPTQGAGGACYGFSPGAFVSLGYNIADDATCGLSGTGDLNSTDPMLGPLSNNGGPTRTHLPLTGSPALNAVPLSACVLPGIPATADQRGISRPQGAACDIGAVDSDGSDLTAPVITPNVSGSLGSNGWYLSPVSVTWSVTDPESGIASSSGCGAMPLSTDTPGITLTCSATNGAGLTKSSSVTIKIDQTAPALAYSRSPAPNGAGWNNTNVTVTYSCMDAMSGVASLSPISVTVFGEGANQGVSSLCTDNAGQSAGLVVSGINIDKTKPVSTGTVAGPNPVAINTGVSLSSDLSDAGGSNLTSALYSINGSTPAVLAAISGPSATVSQTLPGFAQTGVYSVCVHATDAAGNVGADDCLLLPVYDPSGGFVTGGGWINSPAGAYAADPNLIGKANFGFESRYKNGASVPTGDTQFQFKVGNLNFKSTSYEWLVIAGARAQYKGSGAINGSGDYGFILTAIDGEQPGGGNQDRFRIKITGPGGIVYDNQMGLDDNGDPTTALGGGSIVIHKN
jgi:hypothetical protein